MEITDLKVGSKVWMTNSDIYRPSKAVTDYSPREIVGETSRSWLVKVYSWGDPMKIKKKGLKIGLRTLFLTKKQVEDYMWAYNERRRVARLVEQNENPSKLRDILRILESEET